MQEFGANELASQKPPPWPLLLWHALKHPFNAVLAALAVVSLVTGDLKASIVMLSMMVLSAGLRFRQEMKSKIQAESLRKLEPVERGRHARFRIEVVIVAYRHTCALTGCRMTTLGRDKMESIVDAAHIHEFRDSRNNDPRNGLALCKNAHWQFERGLAGLLCRGHQNGPDGNGA